jgi:hypothetical protein
MPLEIMVDTQRKKGVMKLSLWERWMNFKLLLKKFRNYQTNFDTQLSKYSKQAYYNGNPEYYDLPTSQEQSFILGYAKNATRIPKIISWKAIDSTGQVAVLLHLWKILVPAIWLKSKIDLVLK